MTVALAIMVRNEAKILPRLLASVEGIVDTIIALDTGSDDGTIDLLKEAGAQIFCTRFTNFAKTRTELCRLARGECDYMLLADADFIFINNGFDKEVLTAPCYSLAIDSGNMHYFLPRILKADRDWTFKGVVHEFIEGTGDAEKICTLSIKHQHDGFRSQGNKSLQDLALLVEEHLKHPTEPRTVFYLANTLRDLGMNGCAQLYYEQRAAMTGTWEEERWYAQRRAAQLSADPTKMMEAWLTRPTRSEPLSDLISYYKKSRQDLVERFTALRATIKFPVNDILFIENDSYVDSAPST